MSWTILHFNRATYSVDWTERGYESAASAKGRIQQMQGLDKLRPKDQYDYLLQEDGFYFTVRVFITHGPRELMGVRFAARSFEQADSRLLGYRAFVPSALQEVPCYVEAELASGLRYHTRYELRQGDVAPLKVFLLADLQKKIERLRGLGVGKATEQADEMTLIIAELQRQL